MHQIFWHGCSEISEGPVCAFRGHTQGAHLPSTEQASRFLCTANRLRAVYTLWGESVSQLNCPHLPCVPIKGQCPLSLPLNPIQIQERLQDRMPSPAMAYLLYNIEFFSPCLGRSA